MLDFFRQWIGNMVSLALFIVLAEMLLPKGKMRKYTGLATGVMLVIAVVKPLAGLFGGEFDFAAVQSADAGMLEKLQVEKSSRLLEEEQMSQIVKVYRSEITDQIEQNAEEVDGVAEAAADIIIDEDYNSSSFGEIKRIYLEIKAEGTSGGSEETSGNGVRGLPDEKNPDGRDDGNESGRNGIEKVKINPIKGPRENGAPGAGDVPAVLEEKLKDRICRVFGVSREDIVITPG